MRSIKTSDESFSAYSEEFGEHYHSLSDGALSESLYKHVKPAFDLVQKDDVTILDICFGLGYNTLTTLLYQTQKKVRIYSPELYLKELSTFAYPAQFAPFKSIIETLMRERVYEDERCYIELFEGDAREYLRSLDVTFDIVYQDAFSVPKNPRLWSVEYFRDIVAHLDKEGVITTYSSATPVRVAMYNNGLHIYESPEYEKIRTGTIASLREDLPLTKIDMALKMARSTKSEPIRDSTL